MKRLPTQLTTLQSNPTTLAPHLRTEVALITPTVLQQVRPVQMQLTSVNLTITGKAQQPINRMVQMALRVDQMLIKAGNQLHPLIIKTVTIIQLRKIKEIPRVANLLLAQTIRGTLRMQKVAMRMEQLLLVTIF